jgi:hypothetical protein
MDDRRKLEEKAQADPRLLAILQGAGRGGAMTVGAVGGAKLLAAGASAAALSTVAGAPFAPAAAVVGGVAGAIGGGIAAGVGYDALYKKLGEHFTEYDDVMKAAELFPMHKARGEMGMAALAVPVESAAGGAGIADGFPGWRAAAGGSDGGDGGRAGRRDRCGGLPDRRGGAG